MQLDPDENLAVILQKSTAAQERVKRLVTKYGRSDIAEFVGALVEVVSEEINEMGELFQCQVNNYAEALK
jgi:hypothetical protein